jgi:membrane-associated HD superfamily phosphohydrolase
MTLTMTWLIRYGHVLAGALWLGGYVLLALIILPLLAKHRTEVLESLAITTVRVLTYAGTATIAFGLVLITRTRGFQSVTAFGEWGLIIVTCIVIAVALLGIGDGALRPAIQKLTQTGKAQAAQRFAALGLALSVIAIGLMTRALYAVS